MAFNGNGYYHCDDIEGENLPDKVKIELSEIPSLIPKQPYLSSKEYTCYYKQCKNHACEYHFEKEHFNRKKKEPRIDLVSLE